MTRPVPRTPNIFPRISSRDPYPHPDPSFIRRISESEGHNQNIHLPQRNDGVSWKLTLLLCVVVSVVMQIFIPLGKEFAVDLVCRVDFLQPLCSERKGMKDGSGMRELLNRGPSGIAYLEEPLPIAEWSDTDKEKWGVVRQHVAERELEKETDPAVEREALAALTQARQSREGGQYKKAGVIISHALALLPTHPDILTEYGIHLETCEKNLLEAEGFYARALSYNPRHSEALARRATTQPIVAQMDEKMLRELRTKRDKFSSLPRCATLRRAMRESYFSHIYHTVAIEGNTLSLGQTRTILETGSVIPGKSLREHNEVLGMDSALRFLNTSLIHMKDITLEDILGMHRRVLGNEDPLEAGRMRQTQVYVGRFTPVAPEFVPQQMLELIDWLNDPNTLEMDPVERAAIAHYKLVTVHPFVDGNGRTSRLLLNLILMKNGYPPVILPVETRAEYYATLTTANMGDLRPFVRYVARHVDKTLQSYMNLVSTCPSGDCSQQESIVSEQEDVIGLQ